jgi:AcrR family transcriptional regulator
MEPRLPALPSRGPTIFGAESVCIPCLSMNRVFIDPARTVTSLNTVSSQKRKYELKARAETQEATRARIAAAAATLHEEVGVAKTTVADIARRAGVQRLTVYNHFPDLAALLPACTAHWMSERPMPDLKPAFAIRDPAERLRTALTLLYVWYRQTAPMQRRVFGERATVPELDAFMTEFADPIQGALAERLSEGFDRPLVALALDFWTWQRLDHEGLSDAAAAELMARSAALTFSK